MLSGRILFLSAHNGCAGHNAAADAQNGEPQGTAAIVAGLRRRCVAWLGGLSGRAASGTGRGNFNGCFLITADGAFLVLGVLPGCGSFLVNDPLEGVRRSIRLVAAGTFVPVIVHVRFPISTVTMGMGSCPRGHRQIGFDPKALRIAVIATRM